MSPNAAGGLFSTLYPFSNACLARFLQNSFHTAAPPFSCADCDAPCRHNCMISCIRFIAEVLNALAIFSVRTVGSLDAVNAQTGAGGLQPRALLPDLVVDTFSGADSPSPSSFDMPPKRRARGGGPRVETKQPRKPRNEAQTSAIAAAVVEKKVCSYFLKLTDVYSYAASFTACCRRTRK